MVKKKTEDDKMDKKLPDEVVPPQDPEEAVQDYVEADTWHFSGCGD